MKLYKNVLISIIAIVLSSCSLITNSTKSSSIPTPNIGIDIQKERYLEVTAPKGWNSFKTQEPISLMIRNISEKQITADPDFGVKIFIRTDEEWIEVKNKEGYLNDPFTLDPDKNYDPEKIASTILLPDLLDYSIASYIRIFVVGKLIENGNESKKVASYIDLVLNP